jgi:hypothetical protein
VLDPGPREAKFPVQEFTDAAGASADAPLATEMRMLDKRVGPRQRRSALQAPADPAYLTLPHQRDAQSRGSGTVPSERRARHVRPGSCRGRRSRARKYLESVESQGATGFMLLRLRGRAMRAQVARQARRTRTPPRTQATLRGHERGRRRRAGSDSTRESAVMVPLDWWMHQVTGSCAGAVRARGMSSGTGQVNELERRRPQR